MIREFPNIITALENPTADMNATIPTYFGYKLAHENGVNTLFTGDGADLAFWGNPPCNYILEPGTQVRLHYMTPLPIRAFLHKFLRSMIRVNGLSTKRYQNIERIIRKVERFDVSFNDFQMRKFRFCKIN